MSNFWRVRSYVQRGWGRGGEAVMGSDVTLVNAMTNDAVLFH